MSLPRKYNINQMRKLRKLTRGKDIGDITKTKDNIPNIVWIDNPFDRKIDTYDGFIKYENANISINESLTMEDEAYIIWENYIIKNEDFFNQNYMDMEFIIDDIINKNKYKEGIKYMKPYFYDIIENYLNNPALIEESFYNKGKGPINDDFYSNNYKQISNTQLSTNCLQIGKYVKVGNIEGYINSVDNKYVYISNINGNSGIEKISFKKFLKELSKEKGINENSGLYSEYWSNEYNKNLKENVYINDFKTIECIYCGQLVENNYKSKVSHIFNKHFNKPEMDGSVPSKNLSDNKWPYGGIEISKMIKKYF